jgi:hypothetical protein
LLVIAFLAERAGVAAVGRYGLFCSPVALDVVVFPRRLPIAHRHV